MPPEEPPHAVVTDGSGGRVLDMEVLVDPRDRQASLALLEEPGEPKPATVEPVGVSKPSSASWFPAGKIGALAGFEIGSGPCARYRDTVPR